MTRQSLAGDAYGKTNRKRTELLLEVIYVEVILTERMTLRHCVFRGFSVMAIVGGGFNRKLYYFVGNKLKRGNAIAVHPIGPAFPDPVESTRLARPAAFGPAMEHKKWKLFRVRQSNHPKRRILGAAILLNRFLKPGLARGLGKVMEQLSPAKLIHALYAFSQTGFDCVGCGRAIDLAVNAMLAFMHARDGFEWREETQGVSETLYRKFPLRADNEIAEDMTAQLLPLEWRSAVIDARSQQGLLHLAALLKGAH